MLELDMRYLSNKGVFRRVKYYSSTYQAKAGDMATNASYESEDRFTTKNAWLPFDKSVLSVTAIGNPDISKKALRSMASLGIELRGDYVPFIDASDGGDIYDWKELASIASAVEGPESVLKTLNGLGKKASLSDLTKLPKAMGRDAMGRMVRSRLGRAIFARQINIFMKSGKGFWDLVDMLLSAVEKGNV